MKEHAKIIAIIQASLLSQSLLPNEGIKRVVEPEPKMIYHNRPNYDNVIYSDIRPSKKRKIKTNFTPKKKKRKK